MTTQGKKEYTLVDLASLAQRHQVVPINDTEAVAVYGIPFDQMMALFALHLEYLDELLDTDASFLKTSDLVSKMLVEAPELIAKTMCMATRTDVTVENMLMLRSLPAGVQMAIVVEALVQTFPDGELMGKFWAAVEKLVGKFSSELALKLAALNVKPT